MKTFLILLLPIFVNANDTSTFKIREENVVFYNYPNLRLTVSKECKTAKDNKLCTNLKFLEEITLKKAGLEGTGERNPASVICTKNLNGKVYIGIDSDNNENSFCQLPDKSYVDGGTITYYAQKNEGVVQKPRNREKYKK